MTNKKDELVEETKQKVDETINKAKEKLENFDKDEAVNKAKDFAKEQAENLKNMDMQEVKKKWSWKGFFFNGYYYAGKGELKKGLILVAIAGLGAMGGIFGLLGLGVAIYGGLKAREELNLENPFNWKKFGIAVVVNLVVVILALMLKGMFGGGDISLVKNGIMKFNKTITIGEAFDNWQNCETKKWDSFETSNHTRVVEFVCEPKNVSEYFNKAKSLLANENKDFPELDIKSNKEIFQWTINKDGKTFQLDNVQVVTIWKDGKKLVSPENPIEALKSVYNNEISFEPSKLNPMIAKQLQLIFQMGKAAKAK